MGWESSKKNFGNWNKTVTWAPFWISPLYILYQKWFSEIKKHNNVKWEGKNVAFVEIICHGPILSSWISGYESKIKKGVNKFPAVWFAFSWFLEKNYFWWSRVYILLKNERPFLPVFKNFFLKVLSRGQVRPVTTSETNFFTFT